MKDFKKFKLDNFQKEAFESVKNNYSVIVSAPTGSGKTIIAEFVIKKCLEEGQSLIYTAPIKALSNQKFREFNALFPGEVGIITGDVNINPFATLIIMTTEIFRNKILQNPKSLLKYKWIIFDEIHYFDNFERGTVWEESLIFLPSHMRFVGLSATIPNLSKFYQWLSKIHKFPIRKIREDKRAVPLYFFFYCNGGIFKDIQSLYHRIYVKKKLMNKKVNNSVHILISYLTKSHKLPCIYFCFSRKRCEILSKSASADNLLSSRERDAILQEFDGLCYQFGIKGDKRTSDMRELIVKGYAYHHAGIHPMLKEVIEQLFSKKLIQVIFTTETFALGINMPARTVVLDELRKNYGSFFFPIQVRDFYQMAGRAGRRGIDIEGYVYSSVDPFRIKYKELKYIFEGTPERIQSRLNFSYSTILSLYEMYGNDFIKLYSLSFQNFLNKKEQKPLQLKQIRSRLRILKKFGYITNFQLSPKGIFAKKIHGFELPIAELYASGVLEGLSVEELGILALSAVYEPRPGKKRPKLSDLSKNLRKIVQNKISFIHYYEKLYNLTEMSKDFHFDLAASLLSWMRESSFSKVIKEVPFDEGEIIRYYRMAVQLLREILDADISNDLRFKVETAISLIKRGVIDAEEEMAKLTSTTELLPEGPIKK